MLILVILRKARPTFFRLEKPYTQVPDTFPHERFMHSYTHAHKRANHHNNGRQRIHGMTVTKYPEEEGAEDSVQPYAYS